MKVLVEIDGKLHRLVKISNKENSCVKCSLRKRCLARRYSETKRLIFEVCTCTYCGFREVKNKKGVEKNA